MERLILNHESDDLTEVFGFTPERLREISNETEIIFRKTPVDKPIKMSERLNDVVEICDNMNELVWTVFNFGVNVGAQISKRPNILSVGSAEELMEVLGVRKAKKSEDKAEG